jgi:hypothetical protein
MWHLRVWLAGLVAVGAILLASGTSTAAAPVGSSRASVAPAAALCSSGYVDAVIGGEPKCLRAGEFCKVGDPEYHPYGFDCPASGHLTYYTKPAGTTTTSAPPTSSGKASVGRTVLLKKRTKTGGCKLGALPDRRCSPGAYYSGLTKAVICSSSFHTGTIRNVPQSEKYAVEREYGLAAKLYGRTLEIDHIVSLELGGSNDIANLYPEEAKLPAKAPGFHVKDKLENKLHALVCAGAMSLRAAQRGIAGNWEKLYKKVFGVARVGASAARTRTKIVVYSPFAITGGLAAGVKATRSGSGSCWEGSVEDQRSDAWRCTVGNYLYDPCYSGPPKLVACPRDALGHRVLVIHLTAPLPRGKADPPLNTARALPVRVRLTNGRLCGFSGGATATIGGMRLNYACPHGAWLVGGPDRSTPIWTILYLASLKAAAARSIGIATAWW